MTYEEALASPLKNEWQQAINKEIASLNSNDTWFVTDLPIHSKALRARWVFKIKTLPTGEIDRFKARLVVQGYKQRQGIDFTESFAAVVRYESIRLVFALIAYLQLKMKFFDIETAF